VLLEEVLAAIEPRTGHRYIDGTLGGGGHTEALLDASSPAGRVLGIDRDLDALHRTRSRLERFGARVTLVHGSFRELAATAAEHGFAPCSGVVLDLGLSSDQLSSTERGFSFQHDGPLDMRFDRTSGTTSAELLNERSEAELADIFYYFGEERRSRRLARVIVEWRQERPFVSTSDLVAAVESAFGPRRGRIHPATRVFQALRIAVNDELDALRAGLEGAARTLEIGGRLAVISFHSLEDRIVKQFIRAREASGQEPRLRPLSRKPVVASAAERATNPRSRSAKLRIAERTLAAA
jgi:16S rRNA (cytosine1402-N4)-methyltransferase